MTAHINEALFLAPIIVVAKYQADRFAKNKPNSKWFHILWAAAFGGAIGIMWLIADKDYLFACALIVERFVFFNPILNYFRKPRMPFFYVSNTVNPSWWDGALDKVYIPAWIIGTAGFIIIQFFL